MLILGVNFDFCGSIVTKITNTGIFLKDGRFFTKAEVEKILYETNSNSV